MPRPFPGMDPYLENPVLWRGVHDRLIPLIARAINDALLDGYFADINERVYILEDEVREPFVEIMTVQNQDRVVTTIEVVSPANKAPGIGWDQYTSKQRQTLDSRTNLLEIDLLRQGMPTYAPLAESLRGRGVYDYLVTLHRAGMGFAFDVWPFSVRDWLPSVNVPLSDGDADIVLDLQTVFERCYDDGPYRRRVNYGDDPIPPVCDEDAAWLDSLLRTESLRF